MTNTIADEFISRRLMELKSISLPLIVKDTSDYRQLEASLLYIFGAPINYITRVRGNHAFSIFVSYLKSCQTESAIPHREWCDDFRAAMKASSNLLVPNSEKEIHDFLYLSGEGLQKHYERVMEKYKEEGDPVRILEMLTELQFIVRLTKNLIKAINTHCRGLQIKAKPMPPK